jgi:transmembrane sensor
MPKKDAEYLLERYHRGVATEAEKALVESWYLQNPGSSVDVPEKELLTDKKESLNNLLATIRPVRVTRLWPRIAAAASILLLLSAAAYYQFQRPGRPQLANDVKPGRGQATLTLANGQKLVLTRSLNGQLAQQGHTAIRASNGKALTYTSQGSDVLQYNTLTTTRGQESPYVLILADGTRVWLNAASSITYPVDFTGRDREVKITGEAYFEVVHNALHPFKVTVKDQTIEDIGTSFNINAYNDEPAIKTTLVSGSIKIATPNHFALLKPGQMGMATTNGITVTNTDTEGAVAWKNGYFLFDHESLESMMWISNMRRAKKQRTISWAASPVTLTCPKYWPCCRSPAMKNSGWRAKRSS